MAASQLDKALMAILKYERIRLIVAWLCQHEDELGELESLQLVFDCRGGDVKWTITRRGKV